MFVSDRIADHVEAAEIRVTTGNEQLVQAKENKVISTQICLYENLYINISALIDYFKSSLPNNTYNLFYVISLPCIISYPPRQLYSSILPPPPLNGISR